MVHQIEYWMRLINKLTVTGALCRYSTVGMWIKQGIGSGGLLGRVVWQAEVVVREWERVTSWSGEDLLFKFSGGIEIWPNKWTSVSAHAGGKGTLTTPTIAEGKPFETRHADDGKAPGWKGDSSDWSRGTQTLTRVTHMPHSLATQTQVVQLGHLRLHVPRWRVLRCVDKSTFFSLNMWLTYKGTKTGSEIAC